MHQKPSHPESDIIACEVCLTEIPRDLARTSESAEYVHYFCGESCFVQWQGMKDEPAPTKRKRS